MPKKKMGSPIPKLKKELITNVKSRYVSFQKRRKCLEKMTFELSILCDVEACLVVYGPDRHGLIDDQQPHMWPNDPDAISHMFGLYKQHTMMKKKTMKKKKKKEADHEATSSVIVKVEDKKVDETTKNIKFATSADEFHNLSMEQLREYHTKLEERIESVKGRVQFLNSNYQNTEDIFLDTQETHSNHFMPLEEQPISFFSDLEVPDHYPQFHLSIPDSMMNMMGDEDCNGVDGAFSGSHMTYGSSTPPTITSTIFYDPTFGVREESPSMQPMMNDEDRIGFSGTDFSSFDDPTFGMFLDNVIMDDPMCYYGGSTMQPMYMHA